MKFASQKAKNSRLIFHQVYTFCCRCATQPLRRLKSCMRMSSWDLALRWGSKDLDKKKWFFFFKSAFVCCCFVCMFVYVFKSGFCCILSCMFMKLSSCEAACNKKVWLLRVCIIVRRSFQLCEMEMLDLCCITAASHRLHLWKMA